MPAENIGGIFVTIQADLTSFQAQLDQASKMAQQAGVDIGQAFTTGAQATGGFTNAIGGLGTAVQGVDSNFSDLGSTLAHFVGFAVVAEGLKSLVSESLEAYGSLQRTTIALTALTGSAATANTEIENLKSLALNDALSFPALLQANQRLVAFGVDAARIPSIMNSIADAAAATNTPFSQAANAIERMAISGTSASRQLAVLGLSIKDLGDAMGVTADKAHKAFLALDESARLDVLTEALKKYQGTAEETAKGIEGSFNNLSNRATFAFQEIGAAMEPAATAFVNLAESAIPAATAAIKDIVSTSGDLIKLGSSIKDVGVSAASAVDPTGALTTAYQLLKQHADDAGLSFTDVLAPGLKGVNYALDLLILSINTYTGKGPEIETMNAAMAKSLARIGAAATTSSQEFKAAWNASLASMGLEPIAASTKKVLDEQIKLSGAITEASDALAQLEAHFKSGKPLIDGHVVSTQDLATAHRDLQKAIDAVNKLDVNYKDTLTGLSEAYRKNQAEATTLERTIGDLLAITERSADQNAILEAAEKRLDTIHKQLTESTKQLTIAAQGPGLEYGKLTQTYDQLITKSIGLVAAVNDAKAALDRAAASGDHTQAGQIALSASIDQYAKSLKAAGLTESDYIDIESNGVMVHLTVKAALDGMRDSLGAFATVQKDGITILHEAEGAHNSIAGAIKGHSAAQRQLNQDTQDFSDGLSHSILTLANHGTAIHNVADQVHNLAGEFSALVDPNHDATTGLISMTTAANDLANAAANAAVAIGSLSEADKSMNAWTSGSGGGGGKLGSANSVALAGWLTSIQHDPSFSAFIDPSISSPWGPHVQSAEELNSLLNPTKTPTSTSSGASHSSSGSTASVASASTAVASLATAAGALTTAASGAATQIGVQTTYSQALADAVTKAQQAADAATASFNAGTGSQVDLQKAYDALTVAQTALKNGTTTTYPLVASLASNVTSLGSAAAASGAAISSSFAQISTYTTTALAALGQFRDGMGNLYPTIQALNDALAKNPLLGGAVQALGGATNVTFSPLPAPGPVIPGAAQGYGPRGFGSGFNNIPDPGFGLPSSQLRNQSGSPIANIDLSGSVFLDQTVANQIAGLVINSIRNNVRLSTGI